MTLLISTAITSTMLNYIFCIRYGLSPFLDSSALYKHSISLLKEIDGSLYLQGEYDPYLDEQILAILKHPNLNINDQIAIKLSRDRVYYDKFL